MVIYGKLQLWGKSGTRLSSLLLKRRVIFRLQLSTEVVIDTKSSQRSFISTVRSRYNAVDFLQNPHKSHTIARPWGRVTLKRKCRHFDEILITGCTGSCHFDNFQCSQWLKFRQNEDIFVSVLWCVFCGFKLSFIIFLSQRSNVSKILLYWTAL